MKEPVPLRNLLFAQAEALEECAGHLELDWTDDALERAEGMKLSRSLHARALKLRARAQFVMAGGVPHRAPDRKKRPMGRRMLY